MEVLVLNLDPMDSCINANTYKCMVKIKTTLSFGFNLELQRVKETARTISKVLRVAIKTIRTRRRKLM